MREEANREIGKEEEMRLERRAMVVLMVLALAAAIGRVGAQQQLQDCITNLIPSLSGCLDAIQSPTTMPSADCCKGMSDIVKNQMKCLCALYNSPSTVASYGMNMTRLLQIPSLCNVPADISVCKTGLSPPPRMPSAPPAPPHRPKPTSASPKLIAPTVPSRTPAPSSLSGLSPQGQATTPIAPTASSRTPAPPNVHAASENRESRKPPVIIVAISMLIVVLITCVTCGLCWWKRVFCFTWRRKKLKTGELIREEEEERPRKSEQQVSKIGNAMDEPTLDFATIRLATKDFTPTNKLGQGGFGTVYRGELQDGQQIAVKRLSRNTGQGPKHFDNEVHTLAKLQHRNLVRLLGGFQEGEEKLLVYEYVPNGSLDNFLFGEPAQRMKLDWAVRFRLINGIARGLLYLHEDSRLKIIHRDLKAGNILLDEAMNPKISDFGTAKIFDTDQTQAETIMIMGTRGYMAPEYLIEGKVSVKLDVFSFGVLLLEIISGKKNFSIISHFESNESLLNYVWRLWGENKALQVVDDQILLEGACDKDEILRCIHIGLLCVQEDVSCRPRMSKVVAMLENISLVLPSITIPPTWKISNISLGQHTSSTISGINSEHGSTSC